MRMMADIWVELIIAIGSAVAGWFAKRFKDNGKPVDRKKPKDQR